MLKITDKKNALTNYTFIDLFAGLGGFRLALESFGANCIFSCEIEKSVREVYTKNFNSIPCGNIEEIKEDQIPKHDILCAGFPCQSFSISGKQNGFLDTRGTLFFEIIRIVKFHKPKLIFLENVKNFETHDKGETLRIVYQKLSSNGYQVYHNVLNASDYGIPQKRERIYILAFRNDLNINHFYFPPKLNQTTTLKNFLLSREETKKYHINRSDIILSKNLDVFPDMLGRYPNKAIRVGILNKGGQGERIYHTLGHAITLSSSGGGVGAKTGLYYDDNIIRKLAPRECARIMGFPDSYLLSSSDSQSYKHLGNSVVVDVLQHIILQIINTLESEV